MSDRRNSWGEKYKMNPDGSVEKVYSLKEEIEAFKIEKRRVGLYKNEKGDSISTIFLCTPHGSTDKGPILWESLYTIKSEDVTDEVVRFDSYAEAKEFHRKIVERIKKRRKKMSLNAVGNNVVVLPEEAPEKTESGLYLPATASENQPCGQILSVGEEVPSTLEEGDVVVWRKGFGHSLKEGGKEYMVVSYDSILAKVS